MSLAALDHDLEQQTNPAVSGSSLIKQFVYNAAGQQVGLREGSTSSISSAGWQCTTYDTDGSGRIVSQSWPAFGSAPARTETYTYAVGGNPLINSVTDPSGTITDTVDLLGRVISYTDAAGKTTTTSYAQDGQVTSTSGPQGTVGTGYDPNSGLPTTTTFNGTTLATAAYNSAGKITGVTYNNGTSATIGYDNYGNQNALNYVTTASGALIDGDDVVYSPGQRITSSSIDGAANYTPITPSRVADTRTGSGEPYAGDHLGPAGTLNVQIAGANGDSVPANATAAVLNLTAVNPTASTSLTVYPAGGTQPISSVLNATAGETINNQVTAELASNGQVAVYNVAGTVDIVVDVEGYYIPAPSGSARFVPISPTRLADTRTGSGYQDAGETLSSGSTDTVQVTGNGGIPTTGVNAAVIELTATGETSHGVLTAYPDGTTEPTASSLDFTTGSITKEVVVELPSSGIIDVTDSGSSVNMVVDVVGYFTTGFGDQYIPVAPTRIADTRTGSGEPYAGDHLAAGGTLNVQVTGANGDSVPANAAAVVINLTVTNIATNGPITVYATGATQPVTSNLNVYPGQTDDNEVTTSIGTGGQAAIYNGAGTVDVIVDVEGYYIPRADNDVSTYTYDGAGRLTQAAMPNTTETVGYAATTGCPANNAGENTNRTALTLTGTGAETVDYCYNNADQLTSTTTNSGTPNTAYSFDADGNQTNDGGTTATWDSANRLATTTNPAGAVTTYTYDALNRVIEQQDGTTVTKYSYAGMATAADAILNSAGALVDTLVTLPGGVTVTVPAAGLSTSTWSYTNLQGDTTLTATNTGTPNGTPTMYDPWGQPVPGTPTITNTPAGSPSLAANGAQGKLTDPDNNYITMGARPYNPAEGRYLTVDPIQGGCANPYTYAYGDPINHPDLTGQGACKSLPGTSFTCHGFLDNACTLNFSQSLTKEMANFLNNYPDVGPAAVVGALGLGCLAIAATALGAAGCGLATSLVALLNYDQIKDEIEAAAAANGDFQEYFHGYVIPTGDGYIYQAPGPCTG